MLARNSPQERESQVDRGQATEPQFLEGWFNAEFRVGSALRCASLPDHMASCLRPVKKVRQAIIKNAEDSLLKAL